MGMDISSMTVGYAAMEKTELSQNIKLLGEVDKRAFNDLMLFLANPKDDQQRATGATILKTLGIPTFHGLTDGGFSRMSDSERVFGEKGINKALAGVVLSPGLVAQKQLEGVPDNGNFSLSQYNRAAMNPGRPAITQAAGD